MVSTVDKKEKNEFIEFELQNLKNKIFKLTKANSYESCLTAISVFCNLQYQLNQIYSDEDIEHLIDELSQQILGRIRNYEANDNTVLFYDGFGVDLRGWAASYIRALRCLQYNVVYVTKKGSENKIPHIIKELGDNHIEFIDMASSYSGWAKRLYALFVKYKPKSAFFYTTPWDISAAIVFKHFDSLVDRFLIDLTDHAYWLGVNSVDYFLESREMGASLAIYKRNVPKDKIIKIDCVPYINRDVCLDELPFDIEQERYIFTGGSLYKTLGDEGLLYYKIVDSLLQEFKDLKFLYVGDGDDSQIQVLISKYPERVYLISERPDFYRLFEYCEFYLNSYPMFGGLMMRYAALAEKVPLTLKHEHDADGILENQDELNIEFNEIEELLGEARKLLTDKNYYKKKTNMIKNSVLTEDKFVRNLRLIIEQKESEFCFDDIEPIDTTEFQKEYMERFKLEQYYLTCANRMNKRMLMVLPRVYVKGLLLKIKKRMEKI